jgi:pyroglutamyl-peptidase
MRWLVTAFEPFAQAQTNSSQIVLNELKTDWHSFETFRFLDAVPVSFLRAWPYIETELNRDPEIQGLLCLGQAETRTRISLEMVALNRQDARIPDNDGNQPIRLRAHPSSKDLHWTSIPWHEFSSKDHSLIEMSHSAGVYVCNDVFFKTMEWATTSTLNKKRHGGFVHLPLVTSQTDAVFKDMPRILLEDCVKTLNSVLQFLSRQT